MISYYSELVWTMVNEGGSGSKENACQIDLILLWSDETNQTNRYSITMIEHVNNYNVNTISYEKCLPVSICKIKTE